MLVEHIPVEYFKDFAFDEKGFVRWMPELHQSKVIEHLQHFDWVDVTPARLEYYVNDAETPYTYGSGVGVRTYLPRPWNPFIRGAQKAVQEFVGEKMEVCFLNRYKNQRNWLGWHSDDSPEMDPLRPIVIVTFGVERDIQFAPIGNEKDVATLRLEHGSICVMRPGMQQTHMHRIPKAGFECSERVSLTFRGYVNVE